MPTPRRRTPTKTRTLRLADGGTFRIGPGTVSVPVSTVPMDPPAVVLHINRSCGAVELEPLPDGTTLPPQRLNAARVVELVEQINADRRVDAMRGGRAQPPIELPKNLRGTARHVKAWAQRSLPFEVHRDAVGYPSRVAGVRQTLWVSRETGQSMLETIEPPRPGETVSTVSWLELTNRRAAAWLSDNGYSVLPATFRRRAADDEKPSAKRGKARE